MPNISMFFGIIISMYFDDHNPPHFHAEYQDYEAIFDFNGELIEGDFPKRQTKLVAAWATLHQDDLAANWKLAKEKQTLFKIEPLR
ncbi:MAG: DUF4160 domain-containing protein [Candidatus Saccharibacteria bacterium]|nr:DUF4160 domain-containing protein [Candidatus Saccharibacteria bacterium]